MVEDQNKDSQSRLEINVIRWTVLSPAPFFNRFMTGGSDQRQRKKTAAILGGKIRNQKKIKHVQTDWRIECRSGTLILCRQIALASHRRHKKIISSYYS